jgi:hypothetical protein
MGSGVSTHVKNDANLTTLQVADLVGSIGLEYVVYKDLIVSNGIDGDSLNVLMVDEKKLTLALQDLGIIDTTHQKAICSRLFNDKLGKLDIANGWDHETKDRMGDEKEREDIGKKLRAVKERGEKLRAEKERGEKERGDYKEGEEEREGENNEDREGVCEETGGYEEKEENNETAEESKLSANQEESYEYYTNGELKLEDETAYETAYETAAEAAVTVAQQWHYEGDYEEHEGDYDNSDEARQWAQTEVDFRKAAMDGIDENVQVNC